MKKKSTAAEKAAERLEQNWSKTDLQVAESTWAGGYNYFSVSYTRRKKPACEANARRAWSKNGKWSGNNMHVHLELPNRQWTTLVVGNVLTIAPIYAKSSREYKAFWLTQSRGFAVKLHEGYVIKGYHVECRDIETARKKVAKVRSKAAKILLDKRYELRDAKKKWVTVDDSIRAGNCRYGTEAFVNKIKKELAAMGEIGAVRGDVVLTLQNDYYTRRAVAIAEHSS